MTRPPSPKERPVVHHPSSVARSAPLALAAILASVSLSVPAVAPVLAATPDPLAHWAMDAGSGTSVSDSVGDLDATLQGDVSWSAPGYGGSGAALAFDGGWFDIDNGPLVERPELSFVAWIRSAVAPTGRQVIMEKGAFGCEGPSYGLYATPDGIELGLRSVLGEQSYWFELTEAQARVDLWDGAWHHVAFGLSSANDGGSLTLDGYRIHAQGYFQAGMSDIDYTGTTDDRLRVGAPIDAGCTDRDPFAGEIDDLRLFGSALVARQAVELMPPVASSIAFAPIGPWVTGSVHVLEATVTPAPRYGSLWFSMVGDPPNGYGINDSAVHVGDGVYRLEVIAPPTGEYVVTASWSGLAMSPSTASQDLTTTPVTSTTTLAVAPTSPVTGATYTLTATITGPALGDLYPPQGSVTFVRSPGPSEVVLGTVPVEQLSSTTAQAALTIAGGSSVGSYVYAARYSGDDRRGASTGTKTVSVGKAPSFVLLNGVVTAQTHHSFDIWASVGVAVDSWATGTTMTFRRIGVTTPVCVVAVSTSNETRCTVGSLPIGTHSFQATYSGNAQAAASTSQTWNVIVTADTVEATSVTRDLPTVYPVTDGYADVLKITGKRNEPLTVAVSIYNSSGTKVKAYSLSRASGTYSLTWNGRNSSGTILASGKYRIVQTLKDAFGTTKSFTSYVNLSKQRLVDKSTYVYRTATSPSVVGDSGGGSVSISTAGGYVKLVGSYPYGPVGVGYQFTLPSAPVYRSIAFEVYSKSAVSMLGNAIKMQNFKKDGCAYDSSASWSESCFDRTKSIGNTGSTTAWFSTSGSTTYNRYGRTVRGLITVPSGTVYVYKVRVKVVYAILQ